MICCLNPACHNSPCSDDTKFCPNCGTALVVLRNRYRPIRSLGGGGFSKTYLAEDRDKLNEKCVIKQFAPQLQETTALQKATELFEQEARRLQQLGQHPQIPTLLAYFKEDNRLYIVQEFIDGQNLLAELRQQGTFKEQKVQELLLDLLDILKTVHQQQVIHRDIKPENIIRRGSDGKLVLIDFGASKQLTATVMTIPGTAIGSFGYVPVEQMQSGKAYPASDLYSLGATCFYLLTGVSPKELCKKQGYGWVASWRQHLQQPLSQELGYILDKLLQQDYKKRYQSALFVLHDLNDQGQASAPPPVVPPLTQSNRNKGKFIKFLQVLGGSGVILILGLGGYAVWNAYKQKPQVLPQRQSAELLGVSEEISRRSLVKTLTGHQGNVYALVISPDGQTLVSGSEDSTLKTWNLQTGALKTTLKEHTASVTSVAIGTDGQTLVSGDDRRTIKIWNWKTGELKTTLTSDGGFRVHSLAIGTDGRTLVSGSYDDTIKIWNLKTGALESKYSNNAHVSSLAISPDGETLVSGSSSTDQAIKIWNLKTGALKYSINTDDVESLTISRDGETLVTGSGDGTLKIWNLKTGDLKSTLTGHKFIIKSLAISPDGNTLVSGSAFGTLKIWNLQTGMLKTTLTGHKDSVNSVAISSEGKTLVSGSDDNTIKIWQIP